MSSRLLKKAPNTFSTLLRRVFQQPARGGRRRHQAQNACCEVLAEADAGNEVPRVLAPCLDLQRDFQMLGVLSKEVQLCLLEYSGRNVNAKLQEAQPQLAGSLAQETRRHCRRVRLGEPVVRVAA